VRRLLKSRDWWLGFVAGCVAPFAALYLLEVLGGAYGW
jgi:hypothetical protein